MVGVSPGNLSECEATLHDGDRIWRTVRVQSPAIFFDDSTILIREPLDVTRTSGDWAGHELIDTLPEGPLPHAASWYIVPKDGPPLPVDLRWDGRNWYHHFEHQVGPKVLMPPGFKLEVKLIAFNLHGVIPMAWCSTLTPCGETEGQAP